MAVVGMRAKCGPGSHSVSVQGLLYAASHSGVVQVPVANCSVYRSCGDCVLARDPYCAWSGSHCRCISLSQAEVASRPWFQDIEGANAKNLCNISSAKPRSSVPAGKGLLPGEGEVGPRLEGSCRHWWHKCPSSHPHPSRPVRRALGSETQFPTSLELPVMV